MKIECTVEELKELIKERKTPIIYTSDVSSIIKDEKINALKIERIDEHADGSQTHSTILQDKNNIILQKQ